MKKWRVLCCITAMALCCSLSACSSASTQSQTTPENGFSGPYAQEFKTALKNAPDKLSKSILKDGIITEAEVDELIDQQTKCYEDAGYKNVVINRDSSMTDSAPSSISEEESKEIRARCSGDWKGGYNVLALYSAITNNPDKKDYMASLLDCVKKQGFLEEDATIDDLNDEDWEKQYLDSTDPRYDQGKADAYMACATNPFPKKQQ
jgi:hypothetical protein